MKIPLRRERGGLKELFLISNEMGEVCRGANNRINKDLQEPNPKKWYVFLFCYLTY